MKRYGNPTTLKDPRPRSYSHAVRIDNPKSIIFLAGQIAQAADESVLHEGDVEGQVRAAFENVESALESVGATLHDVVDITVYVLDMDEHAWPVRQVRAELFGEEAVLPTSTLVEVSALAVPGTLVELDVIAVLSDD